MDLTRYFEERRIALTEVTRGRRVPQRFTDARAEHMATRRAAGLFDFSFMACVAIKGSDALDFLHTLQTRRLGDLPIGRLRYTLLLERDGTVLNDATVWRIGEEAFLLFTGRRSDVALITALAAPFAVKVRDDSPRLAVIAVQGPRSRDVLAAALPAAAALPYFAFVESEWHGHRLRVARIGYTGELGYEIVCDSEVAVELWEDLRHAEVTECGFEAADSLRIEAGYVLFTNELELRVTPFEIGLGRLVDRPNHGERDKHVRRQAGDSRLVGLLLDRPIEPDLSLQPTPVTGALLTSACLSPLFERWIGLGFVPLQDRYPGTRVDVARHVRATVARLPFYDPMKRLPRS